MDADVSSFTLDVLLQEPDRLEKSIASLKSQFDESMTSNYDFFIKTCENASTITDDLETCATTVADLDRSLQQGISLCSDLSVLAQNTVTSNAKVSAAFRRFNQINWIMEVPQMMNTCRLSSHFDQAIQLYQAIEAFARQYPGIPAIQITLERAQQVKTEVAQTLLDSFAGKLEVADAVKRVNLLRMAGLHTENELRLEIVNGRRKKLHQKVEQVPKTPVNSYVSKMTDVYRDRLLKMCVSYRSLFRDEEDDMTLNMAVMYELQGYVGALREALEAMKNEADAKAAMQGALFFVGALAKAGFNFYPMLDAMFYGTKWAQKK